MTTPQPLQGQVALVTGGASGIGRATCLRLAAEGAQMVVFDQHAAGADETVDLVRAAAGSAAAVAGSVANASDVESAVNRAIEQFGRVSILVNNAGISRGGRVSDISEDDWNETLAVNLTGAFLFCKHVVPLMVEARAGRIVNISSASALRVGPGTSPYSASKAGLIALTKSVAGEVASRGITANAVAPGITDTHMTRTLFGSRESMVEQATTGRIANPMRVVIEPDDIAAAVAFLAGPDARYITGQTLHVNAGAFMP